MSRRARINRAFRFAGLRGRRRVIAAGSIAALLAALALATGVTFARYSASSSATNQLQAATVVLSNGGATGDCNVSGLVPDASVKECDVTVMYTGSSFAWMGLDVFIATKAGGPSPRENLYNPGAADNPPSFSLTDSQVHPVSYSLPDSALSACPSAGNLDGHDYTSYARCYETDDLLVSTSSISGGSIAFKIRVAVPANDATDYQGGSAVVVVRPHAVQAANNGSTSGCSAGTVCSGIGHWS